MINGNHKLTEAFLSPVNREAEYLINTAKTPVLIVQGINLYYFWFRTAIFH